VNKFTLANSRRLPHRRLRPRDGGVTSTSKAESAVDDVESLINTGGGTMRHLMIKPCSELYTASASQVAEPKRVRRMFSRSFERTPPQKPTLAVSSTRVI